MERSGREPKRERRNPRIACSQSLGSPVGKQVNFPEATSGDLGDWCDSRRKKERRGEFSSHSLSAPGCSSSRMIEGASHTRSSSSFSLECREYRFPPLGSFTRHPLLHSPLFFIPGVSASASREKPRTRSAIVFLFEKKESPGCEKKSSQVVSSLVESFFPIER